MISPTLHFLPLRRRVRIHGSPEPVASVIPAGRSCVTAPLCRRGAPPGPRRPDGSLRISCKARTRITRARGTRIHRRLEPPQGSSASGAQIQSAASVATAGRPQYRCASNPLVRSSGVPPAPRGSGESQPRGRKVPIHRLFRTPQRGGGPPFTATSNARPRPPSAATRHSRVPESGPCLQGLSHESESKLGRF